MPKDSALLKKFFYKKIYFVVSLIGVVIACGLWVINAGCADTNPYKLSAQNRYAGDEACKSCHAQEHADWKISDHFKAMQHPNDTTVLGDFNNAVFAADGVTSRFFKRDGKFFIHTEGDDGVNRDYEIKYTFGHYPLQQYLVEFPGGRMQVTRQSWDSRENKWFHQYKGEKIPAGDWLHWTGNAQNWNTMCAECHSTNLLKNYDFETDTYHTTYDLVTVSCESCHGKAQHHIDYMNSAAYKAGKRQKGSFVETLAAHSTQAMEINACFPCHSRKGNISADKIVSAELLDNYIPEIPATDLYYADGQALDEVYKYASFIQSKMYRHGVKCSNCHNPHSGKLIFSGNKLCGQCHAESKYDTPAHTFHAVNTTASECVSCHMPTKTYMGNDVRHDHVFRVPRPDLSAKYAVPNACNDCHNDKPAQWAADAVVKWYGPERVYHFAEDLIPGSMAGAGAEAHLNKVINDSATPKNIVAAAVHYLSQSNTSGALQAILAQLKNADALVRYRALRGLANFSPEQWKTAVIPMLEDKVRAVRIAAADLLVSAEGTAINPDYGEAYVRARKELNTYVLYQTDFAAGNALAGDYFLKMQDYTLAEKFYLRGLQKDNKMNYTRLNLSAVYNMLQRNNDALKVLQEALKYDDKNDRIYFNLALLNNEMNDMQSAEKNLARAAALNSANPRVYYNYGILLQQNGNTKAAEKQYLKGLSLSPDDLDINYAIAVLYLQNGDVKRAVPHAQVLKKFGAGNPQYAPVLKESGI